jgi:hypothetical protein
MDFKNGATKDHDDKEAFKILMAKEATFRVLSFESEQ